MLLVHNLKTSQRKLSYLKFTIYLIIEEGPSILSQSLVVCGGWNIPHLLLSTNLVISTSHMLGVAKVRGVNGEAFK